jgi:hypothetical protein
MKYARGSPACCAAVQSCTSQLAWTSKPRALQPTRTRTESAAAAGLLFPARLRHRRRFPDRRSGRTPRRPARLDRAATRRPCRPPAARRVGAPTSGGLGHEAVESPQAAGRQAVDLALLVGEQNALGVEAHAFALAALDQRPVAATSEEILSLRRHSKTCRYW